MNYIILALILFPDGGYFGGGERFTKLPPQDFNQDSIYETQEISGKSFYISADARLFHYAGGFLKFGAPSFTVLSSITQDTLITGSFNYIDGGLFLSVPLFHPLVHLDLLWGIRYQETYRKTGWAYSHNINHTYIYGLNLSVLLLKIISVNVRYMKIHPFFIDEDVSKEIMDTDKWRWTFSEPEISFGVSFLFLPQDTTKIPAW